MRLLALLLLLPAAVQAGVVRAPVRLPNSPAVRLTFNPPLRQAPNLKGATLTPGLPVLTVLPGVNVLKAGAETAKTPELAVVEAVAAVEQAVESGSVADSSTAGQVLQETITGESFISGAGATLVAAPLGSGKGGLKAPQRRRFQFKPPEKDGPPPAKASKRRYIPVVTLALMGLNVLAYAGQTAFYPEPLAAGEHWGFVPQALLEELSGGNPAQLLMETLTSVTAAFLHGNEGHLTGNMVGLAIFGGALEIGVSRLRYLAGYLAVGALAFLTLVTGIGGPTEGVWLGASGALFGMMGAYVATLPARLRVRDRWNGIKLGLGVAAVIQFIGSVSMWAGVDAGAGGIAHSVHVLGFLIGLVYGAIFLRYRAQN